MLTYRTSMMLYSSVLAFGLAVSSEGFCDPSVDTAHSSDHTVKENRKTKNKNSESNEHSEEAHTKSDKKEEALGAPVSDKEEEASDEAIMQANEVNLKKKAFTQKIREVSKKYTNGLIFIVGKEINVKEKLNARNLKIKAALTSFDPKTKVGFDEADKYSKKLQEKLESKQKFITSEKESITDDIVWFDEVHKYAVAQLKKLNTLREEIKAKPESFAAVWPVYDTRLNNFLSAYNVFTICASYLGNSKKFCHNNILAGSFMKKHFPHFTPTAFTQGANNIRSGNRQPMTIISGYALYALDQTTASSDVAPDSADGKLIDTVKKLSKENKAVESNLKDGGIILSSKIIQLKGMDAPLCVFHSLAIDGSKETLYRFSMDLASKEDIVRDTAQRNSTTIQLIDAEKAEKYAETKTAQQDLEKTLADQAKTDLKKREEAVAEENKKTKKNKEGSEKSTKKESDKAEKSHKSEEKDHDSDAHESKEKNHDSDSNSSEKKRAKKKKHSDSSSTSARSEKDLDKDTDADADAEKKEKSESYKKTDHEDSNSHAKDHTDSDTSEEKSSKMKEKTTSKNSDDDLKKKHAADKKDKSDADSEAATKDDSKVTTTKADAEKASDEDGDSEKKKKGGFMSSVKGFIGMG